MDGQHDWHRKEPLFGGSVLCLTHQLKSETDWTGAAGIGKADVEGVEETVIQLLARRNRQVCDPRSGGEHARDDFKSPRTLVVATGRWVN